MDIVSNIKNALEVYQALGFDRLPLKTVAGCKLRAADNNTKQDSAGCKMQNVELESMRRNPESRIQKPEARSRKLGSETANPDFQAPNHALGALQSFASDLKAAELKALKEDMEKCRNCRLSDGREKAVFGEGNPEAALMFIGEAPGAEEDIQGRPFVGDAGDMLMRVIKKMGFRREDVYISNIVKCRPPSNRDPVEDEIKACLHFIEKQIEIIMPKVIMSLGRIASHTLTGTKIPITKLRGNFYEYKGIPLMPTYHPAYLLRTTDNEEKWRMWYDAEKVLERLKEEGK